MFGGKTLKFVVVISLVLSFVISPVKITRVKAGSLSSVSLTLSDLKPLAHNTHTVGFTLGTAQKMKSVSVRYYKASDNLVKPNNLSLTAATAGTISGLGATWSIDLSSSAIGEIKLVNSETEVVCVPEDLDCVPSSITELPSNTAVSFTVDNVQNPELGDCSAKAMTDTCFVNIITTDKDQNIIDYNGATYDIQEDPNLEFTVSGVDANLEINGITTTSTSNFDAIPFGSITMYEPSFVSHKLKVISNTPNGYEVKMKLDGYIQGLMPNNKIDPFASTNCSWANPQYWSSPTGNIANSDTGWIGANTSDTRVLGWASGTSRFGPVSSTAHTVMADTDRDNGTEIYVTYGMEVNQYQPPDKYAGEIVYQVQTTY